MTSSSALLLPSVLLAITASLLIQAQPACAFAIWMKCWTDLEPGEIIMNHEVIPASASRAKDVTLTAQRTVATAAARSGGDDNDESEERGAAAAAPMPSPPTTRHDDAPYLPEMGGVPFDGTESYIAVTLSAPDERFRNVDVQWAADVAEGGRFVGEYPGDPTVQCDGRRGIGKRKSSVLRLTIDEGVESVEVWAGWATEHEAVTLTERLKFVRSGTEIGSDNRGTPLGTARDGSGGGGPPKDGVGMPPPPPGPPKSQDAEVGEL